MQLTLKQQQYYNLNTMKSLKSMKSLNTPTEGEKKNDGRTIDS